jgi:hypothetical protein
MPASDFVCKVIHFIHYVHAANRNARERSEVVVYNELTGVATVAKF